MVAVGAGFVPAASKELWARAEAMRVHSSGSVHSHQAATLQQPRHVALQLAHRRRCRRPIRPATDNLSRERIRPHRARIVARRPWAGRRQIGTGLNAAPGSYIL